MNDQQIIEKAVELADNIEKMTYGSLRIIDMPLGTSYPMDMLPQWFLDALAAQLVRQVDATEDSWVVTTSGDAHIMTGDALLVAQSLGDDRTMNTLRAIVESGVLENSKGGE